MTAQEWLTCENPGPMLQAALGRVSDQEFRLFACRCCYRIRHLFTDVRARNAVEVAERFAYGHAGRKELNDASTAAWAHAGERGIARWEARSAAWATGEHMSQQGEQFAVRECALDAARAVAACATRRLEFRAVPWAIAEAAEQKVQAALLRGTVGNVFVGRALRHTWPSTVLQVADALHQGQDCGFALHDALLDAGHADLADHFHKEKSHPKRCWALKLILGKR